MESFYAQPRAKDGLMFRCKECHKAAVRANYAANRKEKSDYDAARAQTPKRKAQAAEWQKERRKREPQKYKARSAVGNALRDGRLTKSPCACGATKVQAHHDDYSKPLDVKWECFKCHREKEHGQVVSTTRL